MISTALSYTVDARLSVPGVDVEVQTYRQPDAFECIFEIGTHTLSMSLTPRVSYSRCCYLDGEGLPGPWVEAGDITFSPRGTRMMVLGCGGGTEVYRRIRCAFAPPLFEQTTRLGAAWSAEQLAAGLSVEAPMIKRDLFRMLKEVSESAFGREKTVEATAQILLVDLARYLHRGSPAKRPARMALAAWQLRRITDYVEGMIDHCPSVDQLARLCEFSPRHLARAFKASTGRTVGEYVREVRMMKAKSLLADTVLSQKEIAYRLGFSGPSSFCVVFGKAVGMTPKQFRDQHK